MIKEIFNRIARRYDFLNHFLSFGRDFNWRKATVRSLRIKGQANILDTCTGTGDLALAIRNFYPQARIAGIDFSVEMLRFANAKDRQKKSKIIFQEASVSNLPFEDNSFDGVTMAFALRNLKPDLLKVFTEIFRVLKPGGSFAFLDFGPPPDNSMGFLYSLYLETLLPFVGQIISGDSEAYDYLARSILEFHSNAEVINLLEEAGFSNVKVRSMTFGVVNLFTGKK